MPIFKSRCSGLYNDKKKHHDIFSALIVSVTAHKAKEKHNLSMAEVNFTRCLIACGPYRKKCIRIVCSYLG